MELEQWISAGLGVARGGGGGGSRGLVELPRLVDDLLSHCVVAGAVTAPWQAKGWYLQHRGVFFECSLQAYPG